jgi:hypothetical protein
VAQAAIHQMRQRLGEPFSHWETSQRARDIFAAVEADVRVKDHPIQLWGGESNSALLPDLIFWGWLLRGISMQDFKSN